MSELQPSSNEHGLDLVYVVDGEWDLWLLDAVVALETPGDFIGWLERESVAALLADINKQPNS
jgi:uncharacterized cupin superfamily protein